MPPVIPDYLLEPILWFIAIGVFFFLGLFFFNRYRHSEMEARAFFSGTMVFMFSYVIFRTLEVVRRYFIGVDYNDIVEMWKPGGTPISPLSLNLRLAFLFISWIGIAYFYFRIESTVLEKKTLFILTIASLLKLVVNPLMYFPQFDFATMELINTSLFIIAAFFPTCLFAFYSIRNYINKRKVWAVLSFGMLAYIIGEVGSNPEAYMITSGLNPVVVAYGSPLIVIIGGILLTLGLRRLYDVTLT
ncbi:MAG: hypothetical protein ACTSRS_02530 [Candidatus Helarchaeota archaeon]